MSFYIKRILLISSMFLGVNYQALSQDIQFSEPYSEKLYLNPSYTGTSNCPQFTGNFKYQNIYNLKSFSYNQYIKKINSAFGILLLNNKQGSGAISNTSVSGIYSYRLKFKKKRKMMLAIQISYNQYNINTKDLIFSDMIDPLTNTILQNSNENQIIYNNNHIDFSTGYAYVSQKYRFGIALHHLFSSNQDENYLYSPMKITIHFGKYFTKKNFNKTRIKYTFIPEIIFRKQSYFNEFILGFNLIIKKIYGSIWIKNNVTLSTFSPVVTAGLILSKFRISYTYDISLSKYISLPINSHQISISYLLDCKQKIKSKNTIFCKKN